MRKYPNNFPIFPYSVGVTWVFIFLNWLFHLKFSANNRDFTYKSLFRTALQNAKKGYFPEIKLSEDRGAPEIGTLKVVKLGNPKSALPKNMLIKIVESNDENPPCATSPKRWKDILAL